MHGNTNIKKRITTFKTHKEGVKYRTYCHFPVTAEFGRYLAQIIFEQGKGWKERGV